MRYLINNTEPLNYETLSSHFKVVQIQNNNFFFLSLSTTSWFSSVEHLTVLSVTCYMSDPSSDEDCETRLKAWKGLHLSQNIYFTDYCKAVCKIMCGNICEEVKLSVHSRKISVQCDENICGYIFFFTLQGQLLYVSFFATYS